MKNLKKISRENLKSVKGGAYTFCSPGRVYKCYNIGVCEPDYGFNECCGCYPE
ncbi:hypothetical protein LF887_13730 [Chryseobacterium sp. MEBOG06]|uniref:bacteriocin-like protein n=1 Tax=unclassified Chryseobacterium TaxID=2593645 RepID=UPI001F3A064F|nr:MULTISPECIES: hypothetical protein [unclassified Chryseobacterium]UKB82066.1 hypothetical protein LF887_13730 [Chryseobacterium sp. MEBOG06]